MSDSHTRRKIGGLPSFWYQGSKFSDLSLISDFVPTPRTILDISVNLKRKFFLKGRGSGYWSTVTQNGTGMHHLRPQKPKGFRGRTPRPLFKEDLLFVGHLTNTCIHHQARHYALSDFFVEAHFDPCMC